MFVPEAVDSALRVAGDAQLARIEEAGLNASQPREQLLVDGWLLRFSPGRARRSRSVNAIAPGVAPLHEKLELCRRWYKRFGLPLLVRVTPFSQPGGLDGFLAAAGYAAVDETRVMTAAMSRADAVGERMAAREYDPSTFAAAVGALRGSPRQQVDAHERRLRDSPLGFSTVRLIAAGDDGAPLATGQVVVEDEYAGLYDIVVAAHARGQGHGRAISRQLLVAAARLGARTAYLQVDAGNVPARRIYSSLGFVDRYAYWYRHPADAAGAGAP